MTKIDESSTDSVQPHQQRDERWKGLWQKAKTPLQLIIGQLIGWALRKWLG